MGLIVFFMLRFLFLCLFFPSIVYFGFMVASGIKNLIFLKFIYIIL